MTTRVRSTLIFCERTNELELLKQRWKLASNVENPCPQVVVIKAERGLGKTRLALEFYKWLQENVDGWLTKSYWPDSVEIIDRNLDVNPDPEKCNLFEVPIPYLWWGLRAADIGAENGVPGDAIATYDRFLAPHLAALHLNTQAASHGISLAREIGTVAFDLGTTALHLDAVWSVGKGIFHTVDLLIGDGSQRSIEEAGERSLSRADSVLKDLGREFNPHISTRARVPSPTYAKVPAVIFLDDAQFIHEDPALPSFVERLMYQAVKEEWPLLIIATHWNAELALELSPTATSFANILRHARTGSPEELGPAASLPGGYLTDNNFCEIELKPLSDLGEALREKLPGLIPDQLRSILDNMGGNPRFLEQVIAFLVEHEGAFEDYDTSKQLTNEGLAEILEETSHLDIYRVVLSRLRRAPEDVQEAICLASLQGMSFANDLVDQLAQELLDSPLREPLGKGEHPYKMLLGTKLNPKSPVGQFAERLFHRVAVERRKSLKSLGGESELRSALERNVTKVVKESDPHKTDSPEALALVYGIAASLFERSSKTESRHIAQKALSSLAVLDWERYSLESVAASYERLLAIEETGMDGEVSLRLKCLDYLSQIYMRLNWPAKESAALRRKYMQVVSFFPGQFYIWILQDDQGETLGKWRREHPEVPLEFQKWGVKQMTTACLALSELAFAYPNLKPNEGDESFDIEAFPFRIISRDGTEDENYPLTLANGLKDMAYGLNRILGQGVAERKHIEILMKRGRIAKLNGNLLAAKDLLLRDLEIAESLNDEMLQIDALNELGAISYGMKDEASVDEYLEKAKKIIEAFRDEPAFVAEVTFESAGPGEPGQVSSICRKDIQESEERLIDEGTSHRWALEFDVPIRMSERFDDNPEQLMGWIRRFHQVGAGIIVNLGWRSEAKGDLGTARRRYEHALDLHSMVGSSEDVLHDLKMLGSLEQKLGNQEEACARWAQCMEVLESLNKAEPGEWDGAIEELREIMSSHACGEKNPAARPPGSNQQDGVDGALNL